MAFQHAAQLPAGTFGKEIELQLFHVSCMLPQYPVHILHADTGGGIRPEHSPAKQPECAASHQIFPLHMGSDAHRQALGQLHKTHGAPLGDQSLKQILAGIQVGDLSAIGGNHITKKLLAAQPVRQAGKAAPGGGHHQNARLSRPAQCRQIFGAHAASAVQAGAIHIHGKQFDHGIFPPFRWVFEFTLLPLQGFVKGVYTIGKRPALFEKRRPLLYGSVGMDHRWFATSKASQMAYMMLATLRASPRQYSSGTANSSSLYRLSSSL